MAASQLLIYQPEKKYSIYNRGISGNKVHQLDARWEKDCLDLKPDVLSILIGVNDIWQGLHGRYAGTVKTYADDYRKLIVRTKKQLPDVSLVICEPFVLRCGAVKENWFPEFDRYREAAQEIAKENQAIFIPFKVCLMRPLNMLSPSIGQAMACIQVQMEPPSWLTFGSKP